MVAVITPSTSGARNIHVMIEFLKIILTDVPKDIIHHEKLLDLLAHVGSLTREVSTLVHDIEEKSKSKGSTNRTNRETLDLLKNIELLKEDLKYVYLKAPDPCQCGPSVATNCSWDFHFPSNLKKFVLHDFPLTSNSLSTIAKLPNLEELILMRTIMQGGEWNMGEEDTFENLKYLGLCEVTLAKWKVGEESFPMLEKLQMWGCRMLEEIPPSFGDICSLKIIQLAESPQLNDSTLKIKQYAEHMTGRDELKVEIF
ncbi:putative transcription factor DIVARICATA-like [Capsicum annuum]|nr:putative transcription factor DIVARICATA-like [Capsicum annuum]